MPTISPRSLSSSPWQKDLFETSLLRLLTLRSEFVEDGPISLFLILLIYRFRFIFYIFFRCSFYSLKLLIFT